MGALTDKYCIVGVGETPHMRPSNRTTLSMACEAVRNAMADSGLDPSDISGDDLLPIRRLLRLPDRSLHPSASDSIMPSTSLGVGIVPRPLLPTP